MLMLTGYFWSWLFDCMMKIYMSFGSCWTWLTLLSSCGCATWKLWCVPDCCRNCVIWCLWSIVTGLDLHIFAKCNFLHLEHVLPLFLLNSWLWCPVAPHLPHTDGGGGFVDRYVFLLFRLWWWPLSLACKQFMCSCFALSLFWFHCSRSSIWLFAYSVVFAISIVRLVLFLLRVFS